MAKFLDTNGLLYFWGKIKEVFVAKEAGKGLSTNDFTDAEKSKLANISEGANEYELPIASDTVLGGVKIGTGLEIAVDGTLNKVPDPHVDPVWSAIQNKPTTIAGYAITDAYTKTEVDGGFVAQEAGKGLSTNDFTTAEKTKLAGIDDGANNYVLPAASATSLGGVKVGSNLTIADGVLSANEYVLPTASASVKGGAKIGAGLTMTGDVVSVDFGVAPDPEWTDIQSKPTTVAGYGITDAYTMTAADAKFVAKVAGKGGVKVGTGLAVASDVLSVTGAPWAGITGKPTTISGYGITDAATASHTHGVASTTTAGFMSAADKTKLNGLSNGAPTNHASFESTYGLGDMNNYGHVKLDSSINSDADESYGLAATPSAVKTAYTVAVNASNKANAAMPKTGGTFTGAVVAHSANTTGAYLKNIRVQNSASQSQPTNFIIMVRK